MSEPDQPWTFYRIGELFYPGKTRYENRGEYNWRNGHHTLLLAYDNLTDREIVAVEREPAEFALMVEGDVIVFLWKFGYDGEWCDSTYSWHLVPRDERTLPQPMQRYGFYEPHALLIVFLIEATNSILRAGRAVTLSPAFTTALNLAIIEQSRRPWPRKEAYLKQILALYTRYPTSEEMARAALSRCRGGT